MIIEYKADTIAYYDMYGVEIFEGDTIYMNGRDRKVYKTADGYLGSHATNPIWIESGKAVECEYGIYPFTEDDEPIKKGETRYA